MESAPLSLYLPHKSKRRVFPGSSSSYIDLEVAEISPLGVQLQESRDEQGFYEKVADGDMGGDYGNLMPTDETVGTKIKGKGPLVNSYGENSSSNLVDGGGSSNKSSPQNSFSQYVSECDDEFVDIYDSFTYEDEFTYDDDYTFLQAHFDSMDIPTGVEVTVPSLFDPSQNKNNTSIVNCSSAPIQSDVSSGDLVHPSQATEFTKAGKKSTYLSSSSMQTPKQTPKQHSHSSPGRFKKMKKLSVHASSQGSMNPPPGFKPWCKTNSWHGELDYNVSGSSSHLNSYKQHLKNMYNLTGKDKSSGASFLKHKKAAKHLGKRTVNVSPEVDLWWKDSTYTNQVISGPQPFMNQVSVSSHQLTNKATAGPPQFMNQGFSVPPPLKNQAYPYPPLLKNQAYPYHPPYMNQVHTGSPMTNQTFYGNDPFQELSSGENIFYNEDWGITWAQHPAKGHLSDTAEGSSWVPSTSALGIEKCLDADGVLKKFHLFKQFDTVVDHADHHYSSQGSQVKQPPKKWAKKIQDEWRILEKDLPDSIYVRVYESRMDLLRAVIVGAEGTPYHDGLFFFDIFFPSSYPDVPPLVYYHSGGLRINPNLYNNGKVCLSLLNTWSGRHTEKWVPGLSTMLQVLVSIQALILNAKPYFNEPGYATMSGSISGERQSQQYNESTFVLSLRTMVYTIKRRPKHFEDFVVGHFLERAQDILLACKAYIEGAQVGCLTRGGVQDVDAGGRCCSSQFRNTVASCIPWLVKALSDMGAKDCEKFLPLGEKVHSQPTPLPVDGSAAVAAAAANLYEPAHEPAEWSDFVIYA